VGNFETYNSKALADFIIECNQGNSTFFLGVTESALDVLHRL
jgi:hypothetical protein